MKAQYYQKDGKTYIPVGPYGTEDVEVELIGGKVIYGRRQFNSVQEAFARLNAEWTYYDNLELEVENATEHFLEKLEEIVLAKSNLGEEDDVWKKAMAIAKAKLDNYQ